MIAALLLIAQLNNFHLISNVLPLAPSSVLLMEPEEEDVLEEIQEDDPDAPEENQEDLNSSQENDIQDILPEGEDDENNSLDPDTDQKDIDDNNSADPDPDSLTDAELSEITDYNDNSEQLHESNIVREDKQQFKETIYQVITVHDAESSSPVLESTGADEDLYDLVKVICAILLFFFLVCILRYTYKFLDIFF